MTPSPRRADANRGHPGRTEHSEQAAVIDWTNRMIQCGRFPEFEIGLFAVPNWRVKKEHRLKMWREGVKAGVSDLILLVPRGEYHGLVIEVKLPGEKPDKDQKAFLKFCKSQGYCSRVCWGADHVIVILEWYMELT